MTLAASTPTPGGPEAAQPSSGHRPAKRRPPDKPDHDDGDLTANGGPSLAFLAILQGIPVPVTPGKSALVAAGQPANGGEPTADVGGASAALGDADDKAPAAPVHGYTSANPQSGAPSVPAVDGRKTVVADLSLAIPSTVALGSLSAKPIETRNSTATTADRKSATAAVATAASALGAEAGRATTGASPESHKETTTAKPDSAAPPGNSGQHSKVQGTLAAADSGQRPASTWNQPPFRSPDAPEQTASARPPSSGASLPRGVLDQPGSSQPGGTVGVPTWDAVKSRVDAADATAPSRAAGSGPTTANAPAGVLGAAPLPWPISSAPGNAAIPVALAQTVPAQVLQQLLERLPQAGTTVVMRLDPPLLGSVVMRVVAGNGRRIRFHFEVEDPSVGDALAGGLGQLESALRSQGISPEGCSVGMSTGQFGGGPAGQSGQGSSRSFPGQRADSPVAAAQQSPDPSRFARVGGGRYVDYLL